LGRALHAGVCAAGFDPALSFHMGIDHGIAQAYGMLFPERTTPILPIMVNAAAVPMPTLARCHAFGVAAGAAIRNLSGIDRILVLASGGLSHWIRPTALDDPALAPADRAYLIDGRASAQENSAKRDASVEARRATIQGRVNADWDLAFLDKFKANDVDSILAMDPAEIEAVAGNGAHEIRAWLCALGAWNGRVDETAYAAVPEWATGMGFAAAYATAPPRDEVRR
jgi:2,3-dihydroxyphenylpropionate 1,2-dioxygenase